jgi:hypothetical protein
MLQHRSRKQSVSAYRGIVLIIPVFCFLSVLVVGQATVSSPVQGSHSTNDKSKLALACKADIQRYCSGANLKQECLVARWDRISVECRYLLGTSGNRADSGT